MAQGRWGQTVKVKRRPGRKPLSEAVFTAIFRDVASGLTLKEAHTAHGVSASAFYRALRRNRQFRQQLEKSLAGRLRPWLNKIAWHGRKHWQALAWLCERLYPERFSLRGERNIVNVQQSVAGQPLPSDEAGRKRMLCLALGIPVDAPDEVLEAAVYQWKMASVRKSLERYEAGDTSPRPVDPVALLLPVSDGPGLSESTSRAIDEGAGMLPPEPPPDAATSSAH